jgi:hypothetical protein
VTGLIAQVLLLAALGGIVGLGRAGWVVGVTCAVITNAALAHGLSRYRTERLGRADWVTLARSTLAVAVAALVADSFDGPTPVTMLVSLAAVALALDAVDGWVARRMGTTGALGEQLDAEVDAFLILALSVYVARSAGAWVLAIGAARYAFLAGGWALPWMRAPLPARHWRKFDASKSQDGFDRAGEGHGALLASFALAGDVGTGTEGDIAAVQGGEFGHP